MKRILLATALTCVIATAALGGEIPSVGLTSQDPNPTADIETPKLPSTDADDAPVLSVGLVQMILDLMI